MCRRKMIREALTVGVAALFVTVALPVPSETVFAAGVNGYVERVSPSESTEVEKGGGNTLLVAMKWPAFGNDAGHVERLLASESSEEATGGGETTLTELKPTRFGHDAGYSERLLPSAFDQSGVR
jgi:hypothetical protein